MRTRVKICGITNEIDLRDAISAGADAVGFNMYKGSPRYVDRELAGALVSQTPPMVTTVGLFVNHSEAEVRATCDAAPFDVLQFHGDESDEFCAQFQRRFLKALRVGPETDIAAEAGRFPSCSAYLLDTLVEGAFGGTGSAFDWRALPVLPKPVVLAGGLDANNVAGAIGLARPWAVDVSSGVEAAAGRKDRKKIEAFISAVRRADGETS